LKLIPSVIPDALPDVAQVTSVTLTDVVVADAQGGPGTIELVSTATDPLARLEVHEVVAGVFCRLSFDLPGGRVAHDYLTAAAAAPPVLAG
jgi:acetoacetate decarboxylase